MSSRVIVCGQVLRFKPEDLVSCCFIFPLLFLACIHVFVFIIHVIISQMFAFLYISFLV